MAQADVPHILKTYYGLRPNVSVPAVWQLENDESSQPYFRLPSSVRFPLDSVDRESVAGQAEGAYKRIWWGTDLAPWGVFQSQAHKPASNYCFASIDPVFLGMPDYELPSTYLKVGVVRKEGFYSLASPELVRRSYYHIYGYPNPNPIPFVGPVPDDVNRQDAVLSTLAAGDPGASLDGFMVQLLEAKETAEGIGQLLTFLKYLWYALKNKGKLFRELKKGLSFRALCKKYLTWKFGVEPVPSQVEYFHASIWEAASSARTRLAQLTYGIKYHGSYSSRAASVRNQLRDTRKPYGVQMLELERRCSSHRFFSSTHTFSIDPLTGKTSWDGSHDEDFWNFWQTELHTFCAYFVRREVIYSTFTLEGVNLDVWRQVFDVLYGFVQPISSGWQVFPLSFVVNWFVNFDQLASRLDKTVRFLVNDQHPLDGSWRATQYACGVLTDAPFDKIRLAYTYDPVFTTVDTSNGPLSLLTGVRVVHRYDLRPPGWETARTGFVRRPIELDWTTLLLPRLNISLNGGKLLSLLALGGAKLK